MNALPITRPYTPAFATDFAAAPESSEGLRRYAYDPDRVIQRTLNEERRPGLRIETAALIAMRGGLPDFA